MLFSCCDEESFYLSSGPNPTSIPSDVVNACLKGRHVPVVPHRQRLLVASIKEARVAKDAPKPKDAPKAPEDKPDPKPAVSNKKYGPTPYGVAKNEFFAKLPGLL